MYVDGVDQQRTPHLAREGPTLAECRIIGVELAARPPNGQPEVELEMFACCHTLPINPEGWGGPYQFRVTLHTSRGDRTMQAPFTL